MSAQVGADNRNGHPQTNVSGHLLPSPIPNSPPTTSTAARPGSRVSAISSLNEKVHEAQSPASRTKSHSVSSNPTTVPSSRGSVSAENRARQRAARTLPPWVQTVEHEDGTAGHSNANGQLRAPEKIRPASHNFMPEPKANAVFGKHFDHAREGIPVTITSPISENASKWQLFAKSTSARPSSSRTRGEVVDEDWLKENLPDLETPWQPEDVDEDEDEAGFWLLNPNKRRRKMTRVRRNVMNHPMVPLVVRLTVLIFSCLALGLAGSIFHKAGRTNCDRGSSTYLAIIVDVIAILYTAYITYDEYTSKPLGLRSHRAKMRLIFFDLVFIVFDSANLSLAFEALTDDRWACRNAQGPVQGTCELDIQICSRQKALTATLLIALVAWLVTFAISTLRLIEKIAK